MDTLIDASQGSNLETMSPWIGAPDTFDLAAEREAQAEAALADLTPRRIGRLPGSPITCADAATAPVGADGKVIRQHRNSHKRAVDKWLRLVRLLDVANNLNASDDARRQAHVEIERLTRWNLTSAADRARCRVRRERRKLLLARLNREKAKYVRFDKALTLADLADRTLYRQCQQGRVGRVIQGRNVMVAVADLRAYLKYKIAA